MKPIYFMNAEEVKNLDIFNRIRTLKEELETIFIEQFRVREELDTIFIEQVRVREDELHKLQEQVQERDVLGLQEFLSKCKVAKK